MSEEPSSNNNNPVLRVTQLDTNELNTSLLLTIKRSINDDLFKYIHLKFIQRYHTEIFALLKFILWSSTYAKTGQTVGQSIFDWSYRSPGISSLRRIEVLKKIAHACVYCLDEWFEQKFVDLLKKVIKALFKKRETDESGDLEKNLNRGLEIGGQIYRSLSFVNYVVFLFNGKYMSLWERLLRLQPVYKQTQFMSRSNGASEASVMREELWQAYFSVFRLSNSLFDFGQIYRRYFGVKKTKMMKVAGQEIELSRCGICGEEVVQAHRSIGYGEKDGGCKHVFCYVCIRQEMAENGDKYFCDVCERSVDKIELFVKT